MGFLHGMRGKFRRTKMLKEFKEFAMKGNMVDLAIGVIIGGAFGGLVNSVVNDILMPIIARLSGGADFSNKFVQLSDVPVATTLKAAQEAGPTLAYGNFITLVINFLIIAWVLFMVVKGLNSMKKPAPEAAPAAPPAQEVLLGEIRDLLAKGAKK
jgi:large conductance mechanosensitive channel